MRVKTLIFLIGVFALAGSLLASVLALAAPVNADPCRSEHRHYPGYSSCCCRKANTGRDRSSSRTQ